MDELVIKEYIKSALYALALNTPRAVIQYGELSFAEEDNFEGAEGFKRALEMTQGRSFNCQLKLPDGLEVQLFTEQDEEDFYNEGFNEWDYLNDDDDDN